MKSNKGFTLVEMAIVLVIIGIILGAVIKGQDLIENAKAKQFVSKIKEWEIALNTYYDRKGRFPGDDNKDGIIQSGDTLTPLADITAAQFVSAPSSSFTIGGTTFVVKLGNDGATPKKNFLVVCKDDTCSTAYDPANSTDLVALKFFEAYDTAIDGSADATLGSVRGYTTVTAAANGIVTALSGAPAAADWMTGSTKKALGYQLK